MQESTTHAPASLSISILSTIIAFISVRDMQTVLTFISAGVAIISGILAARYYYFSSKEKKLLIKKLENEKDNK